MEPRQNNTQRRLSRAEKKSPQAKRSLRRRGRGAYLENEGIHAPTRPMPAGPIAERSENHQAEPPANRKM
jgi:hypothetical protein